MGFSNGLETVTRNGASAMLFVEPLLDYQCTENQWENCLSTLGKNKLWNIHVIDQVCCLCVPYFPTYISFLATMNFEHAKIRAQSNTT